MRAAAPRVSFVPSAIRREARGIVRDDGRGAPSTRSWGSKAAEPYHFRARIKPFQAVAAPIAGFRTSPLCLLALPLRYAGDRNAAVPETDDRLAKRAAPRLGCRPGRREGLRRNWTLGLLDLGGDDRTKVERSRTLVKKLLAFLEGGEPTPAPLRDVLRPLP